MRATFVLVLIAFLLPGDRLRAQDHAALDALRLPFDARPLTPPEKRLLQIGLKVFADYVGLIDGAWGGRSQKALELLAAKSFPEGYEPAVGPLGMHAAFLANDAELHLEQLGLGYRVAPGTPVAFVASRVPFATEEFWREGPISEIIRFEGLTVGVFRTDAVQMAMDHQFYLGLHSVPGDPYTVRNADRLVTSVTRGQTMIYARSEPYGGSWYTAMVFAPTDERLDLFRLVTASLAWDPAATESAPRTGQLARMISELRRIAAEGDAPTHVETAALPAPSVPDPKERVPDGTGTAFYVNNVDLVTAAHVVDGCAQLSFADGTPIRVVAQHPTLDLALLTSDRRSRSWLSLDRTGNGRLGQKVYALGYPFYGMTGTSLNLTAGNVSAERGLADSESEITVTAAVQPGNSGGPLLSRDGSIMGVVIAKLSAKAMLEAAGTLPENVNFAVRGADLLTFLDDNAVLYPKGVAESFDLEDGVPNHVQDAIVPVFCHGSSSR